MPKTSKLPAERVAKSRDKSYMKLTVYIPTELHRQVKAKLILQGKELSVLVTELFQKWNSAN